MSIRRGRQATSGFFSDFRDFIMRGNVIDLAVAVIIGGAFGNVINSLVADILTPAILNPAMQAAGVDKLADLSAAGIQYGLFLAAIINFIVIAFCMFLVVRSFTAMKNRVKRAEEVEAAEAPPDPAIVAQERLTQAIERLTSVMERPQ
ncbi:MAG: large conductance mechanosensitive channel protein MscL [Leptolyngbya sp. DLM2.Bin15]|jgi:large conductance mechanosensitive channel|nr:large conductance mechanosensitive channel protein MscL [Synechococcales cyanobacterium K32_A2020_035]MBF2094653.1 large conductance mechanosensitive channel protein MscL [Synechococcales cyanobacterium K44_A2020_017]TVQ17921.1 MAG: large conductance mechanosensitive channel protein MscL [Leptolyngbya sp. DLM2.Bin15]